MPFDVKSLVALEQGPHAPAGANFVGYKLAIYAYATTDTHAQVLAAGYFNGAAKLLKRGDTILAVVDFNGNIQSRQYLVTNSNGTVVTAVQQTFSA